MVRARSRGFTLIELLVVIAIIAILVALLLPAVQQVREAARKSMCQDHLHNVAIAMHTYHDSHKTFPYGWDEREKLWQACILPQIEQKPLYDTLIYQESGAGNWDSGSANETACATVIPLFRCPSLPGPENVTNNNIEGRVPISYRVNAGSNVFSDDASTIPAGSPPGAVALENLTCDGTFWGSSKVAMRDIVDGTSNTIIIGESATDPAYVRNGQGMDYWQIGSPQTGGWVPGGAGGTEYTEGVGATSVRMNGRFDPTQHGIYAELGFGSWHAGGAMFAMGDGKVNFISENVDLNVYRAIGTRQGGEVAQVP
ncbi:MAG: DUF1559 domain-containing protein [Planctomycetaceae bacterium]